MEDDMFKPLVIVLVIGIILTLSFNLWMRHRVMQEEGFSALYFEDHRNLPERLNIGNNFSVAVTFSNHELNTTNYVLEITSGIYNFSRGFTLEPGEEKTAVFSVDVNNKAYETAFSLSQGFDDAIDNIDNGYVSGVFSDAGGLYVRNIMGSDHEDNKNVPVSFSLGTLGEIYHVNLSYDELLSEPFERSYHYSDSTSSVLDEKSGALVFYAKDDRIFLKAEKNETTRLALREPFVVKLYKVSSAQDEELEIHFWYEVV